MAALVLSIFLALSPATRLPRSDLVAALPPGFALVEGEGDYVDAGRGGRATAWRSGGPIGEVRAMAELNVPEGATLIGPTDLNTAAGEGFYRAVVMPDGGPATVWGHVATPDGGTRTLRLDALRPGEDFVGQAVATIKTMAIDDDWDPSTRPGRGIGEQGVTFEPPADMALFDSGYASRTGVFFVSDPDHEPDAGATLTVETNALPAGSHEPIPAVGERFDPSFGPSGGVGVIEAGDFETAGGGAGVEVIGGHFVHAVVPRVYYEARVEAPDPLGLGPRVWVVHGDAPGLGPDRERWLATFRAVARSLRPHRPFGPVPPAVVEAVDRQRASERELREKYE